MLLNEINKEKRQQVKEAKAILLYKGKILQSTIYAATWVNKCQRMLAQLVVTPAAPLRSWVRLPVGANFRLRVKKIPSLAPCAKALVKSRPRSAWGPCMAQAIPKGYGSQCQGGAGVRGFSWLGKPRLLLSLIPVGRSFPTRPSLIYNHLNACQWICNPFTLIP